jgi:hypothetical protein
MGNEICPLCEKYIRRGDGYVRLKGIGHAYKYHFDCVMETTKPHPATKKEVLQRLGIKEANHEQA